MDVTFLSNQDLGARSKPSFMMPFYLQLFLSLKCAYFLQLELNPLVFVVLTCVKLSINLVFIVPFSVQLGMNIVFMVSIYVQLGMNHVFIVSNS